MPLLIGRNTDKVDALDEVSGCVGDQSKESDIIGRLGLGAQTPLAARCNKRFESYSGDQEPLSQQQKKTIENRFNAARRKPTRR